MEISIPQTSAMTGTILVPANVTGKRNYNLSRWLGGTAMTDVTESSDIQQHDKQLPNLQVQL